VSPREQSPQPQQPDVAQHRTFLMISRNRSISRAAAMSIERTTSANRTVTCLYSAGVVAVATAAPHSLQNFEVGGSSVPQAAHANPAAVIARSIDPVDRRSRQYRVTAGQTTCVISPRQSGPTGSSVVHTDMPCALPDRARKRVSAGVLGMWWPHAG
jgi:hypothetical protein